MHGSGAATFFSSEVPPVARRVSAAVASLLILSSTPGCLLIPKPDSFKIASAANSYHYWADRYAQECPAAAPTIPAESCRVAYVALNDARRALEKANEALKRGGALPLQMSDVKSTTKKLAKVGL